MQKEEITLHRECKRDGGKNTRTVRTSTKIQFLLKENKLQIHYCTLPAGYYHFTDSARYM